MVIEGTRNGRSRVLASLLAVLLPALGVSVAAQSDARLADAVMKRDAAAVRSLLGQKVDVNAPGKDGTPALHWAVREDDLATARLLLGAGADARACQSLRRHAALSGVLERQRGDDPAAARCRAPIRTAADPTGETAADGRRARRNARRGEAAARARCGARRQGSGVPADGADGGGQGKPSRRRGAFWWSAARDVNAKTRTGDTPAWVLPNSVPGFGHGVGIVRGGLPDARLAEPDPGSAVSALICRARRPARDRADARRRQSRCEPGRRQRHHAADRGDYEQSRRRGPVPDRSRRRHQRERLVRPDASVGSGRNAQHGLRQRHVRKQHRSRALPRADPGPARTGCRSERTG